MTDAEGGGRGRAVRTILSPDEERRSGLISVSVLLAYLVALALIVLPPFLIIGDPWGVATDLRFYDEIWVISGGVIDDGDYEVSARPFTWTPFIVAVFLIILAYRMRASRQIMIGRHFGIPDTVKNQVHSFFFGRGLNVLFPFGPGDLAIAQALVKNGADHKAATTTVFYYRVFEVLAVGAFLGLGLIISGWTGAGAPVLACVIIFFGVSFIIRPLGRFSGGGGWLHTLGFVKVFEALREIGRNPGLATRLFLTSVVALFIELIALFLIKNALSAGDIGSGDEYLLLDGVPFAAYIFALAVASLARIIPFTPGGMGIYEMSMVTVLVFFEAEETNAAATAMADGFVTNLIMLGGFFLALRSGSVPSAMGSWKGFFRQSVMRAKGEPVVDKEALEVS